MPDHPPLALNTLRDARYGLRGVRVGEASDPTEAVNQVGRGVQLERSAIDSARDMWVPPQRGTAMWQKESLHDADVYGLLEVGSHQRWWIRQWTFTGANRFLATHGGNR